MKNTKGLIVIVGLVVALLGVSAWLGISHTQKSRAVFEGSGYILEADSRANSEKILISQGDSYNRNELTKELTFEDAAGEKQIVSLDTFVHYDDGSVAAMSEGVVLDLEDVSGNLVNHYPIKSGVKMTKNGSRFDFSYDGASLDFGECLWKISDAKYMVCAPDLQIHFAEDDVRPAGDNLQICYIDGGVVQLITEENIWHTIAPNVYVEAPSGARFYLASQMLEKDNNKMFASKLSHSANDPATLPYEEQNNLAVPEISIEAVDGKDGDAGEDGADGVSGTNGTGGQSGEDGVIGEDGAIGQTGEDGEEGEEGSAGGNGNTGTAGAAGATGGKGNAGSSGDIGDTGYTGNRGNAGLGVEGDSSSKTALPVMTFTDWDVTGSTVRGTIVVADEREILTPNTGSVTIFEAKSDQNFIVASTVNDDGSSANDPLFNFSGISEEGVRFIASGLKPDTEYRITVSSDYVMSDNSGAEQTYKRDFIVRTFYTDSAGAYMEVEDVRENSIKLTVNRQSYSDETAATVYLLSENQYMSGFNIDNVETGYASRNADLNSGSDSVTFSQVKENGQEIDLKANTLYAAYLLSGTEVAENMISDPVLIKTLKRPLEFDADKKVSVSVNRQKGGFEVYRPKVTDIDAGIQGYIYECLDGRGNVVRTITITDPAIELATFFVDNADIRPGVEYTFRVKCIFDDNQKETEISLGKDSEPVKAMENNIPAIEWKPVESEHEGAADIGGNIIIHTSGGSISEPTADTPITLHILADGVYENTILFQNKGELTWESTEVILPVKLQYLSENTTYRVAVRAYVGGSETQLGFVTFSTRSLVKLSAEWSITDQTGYAVAREFYLKPVKSDNTEITDPKELERATHDIKSIGRMELTLYRGSGANKYKLETVVLENQSGDPYNSDIAQKYFNPDEPMLLSESFFGLSSGQLNDSFNYTLEVTGVYDYTYNKQQGTNLSGYVNEFEVNTRSENVTKSIIPPELPAPNRADQSLLAEPIPNQDAAKYGKTVNENLPNNAVIGYRLTPTYDNGNSLARKITFYAYEAQMYKNSEINQSNVVYQDELSGGNNYCFSYTLDVSAHTAEIPGLIVFFGDGEDTYYEGTRVAYAGEAKYNSALKTLVGMDRGYQYVFAYTVGYSENGVGEANKVYPFDMADFKDYQDNTEYKVYTLNSGIKKAPRSNPIFYAYPLMGGNGRGSNGSRLTIRYYYTDADNTIEPGNTGINLTESNGTVLPHDPVGQPGQWNDLTLNLRSTGGTGALIYSPWLDYKKYEIKYEAFSVPGIFDKEPTFYIGHYPIERPSGTVLDAISKLTIQVDAGKVNQNQLIFIVQGKGMTNDTFQAALRRVVALKVIFTQNGKKLERYLRVDPNSREASMSTAELDSMVGGNAIHMTYELLYDTGVSGWDLLKTQSENGVANIALQRLVKTSIDGAAGENVAAYTLGNYLSLTTSGANNLVETVAPSNALLQYDVKRGGVSGDYSAASFALRYTAPTAIGNPWTFDRGYSFSINGIAHGYYNADGTAPGNYEMPKQVGKAIVRGDTEDDESLLIDAVTPSVTLMRSNLSIGVERITIRQFTLNGFDQFFEAGTKPQVRFEIYKTSAGAETGDPVAISDFINVEQNKNVYNVNIEIAGLERNTDYCIIVRYRRDTDDSEEWIKLMSSVDPTATNYLPFTTNQNVTVTKGDKPYVIKNDGYFAKTLTFEYTISQSYAIRIEYELWSGDGTTKLADADELDRLNMIKKYPANYSYTNRMSGTMNIGNGTLIRPGNSYRFYIRIYQKDGDSLLNTETDYILIQRPMNAVPSSYIEAFAGTTTLDFYVTVTDTDSSVMGRRYGTTESTAGIYKVRLFRHGEGGEWVYTPTEHDNTLFYLGGGRQQIHFENLAPESEYKIALYAVLDVDESGLNDNGPDAELEKHDWSYYYRGTGQNDGASASCNIADYADYEINSRIQRTLDDQGIYIGAISLQQEPNQPQKIRLMLNEASGLDRITSINYSISGNTGYNNSAEITNQGGSLFMKGTNYSYFTFPDNLKAGSGTYTVVVQLKIGNDIYRTETFTYNKLS